MILHLSLLPSLPLSFTHLLNLFLPLAHFPYFTALTPNPFLPFPPFHPLPSLPYPYLPLLFPHFPTFSSLPSLFLSLPVLPLYLRFRKLEQTDRKSVV